MKAVDTKWRELKPGLLVFASSIACVNPWCARESGEEFVQEAVLREVGSTRAWNLRTSSLDLFLCSYKEIP